jgi:uncharacterized protein
MTTESILVDTGAVVALLDTGDKYHEAVESYWDQHLLLPITLLAEIDYMVSKYLGAHVARAFFAGVERGDLELIGFDTSDFTRSNAIMARYPSVPLGIADASVMALAERHQIKRILTLDRRHFSLVKPINMDYFELLP